MTVEQFHRNRVIFYIDPITKDLVFPDDKYINLSHGEWFRLIGLDINNVDRGYFYNDGLSKFVMIYRGTFDEPSLPFNYLAKILDEYVIDWIGLGCKPGEPGQVWEPKYKLLHG